MKIFKRFLVLFAILALLFQVPFSCAQRGRPSGGPQDTIPPVFVRSLPPNYSTHFKSKTIRIDFDEFIKLEDPQKQILISPPMKVKPIIKPMGQTLRYIEIDILDTLLPNTTYTINFGQSIVDNNEGNPFPFFKYVFSTGDFIDSLSVSGRIKDAFERNTPEFVSVMLYKIDSTYNDSIIYKKPPTYIAYTRDTTHTFNIENVAEGRYKIVAIKDKNQNYIFNPKTDKIGFLTDTVHVPSEREFDLTIFKQIFDYKPARPEQLSAQNILLGFEGGADSLSLRMISEKPAGFEEFYYKRPETDSIDYWFKPAVERDSLVFEVNRKGVTDTLTAYLKEMETDSLKLRAQPSSALHMTENFTLSANTPLTQINTDLIEMMNKDSLPVPFTARYEPEGNKFVFEFEKDEKELYGITAYPGALMDFYGQENDTLKYRLSTKAENEYADVHLTFQNLKKAPVIVQLVDSKGVAKRQLVRKDEGSLFSFKYVEEGMYYIRIIYDENDNGIWDTGDYLKKRQPEKAIYMKHPLDVRKNWEISQTYILE